MDAIAETLLVDQTVQLERFPGKGGWTFVRIPDIPNERAGSLNWKKVNGFIDAYEIKEAQLMPLGKGRLFLPVKADIRKAIGKQEGDWAKITLYLADKVLPVTDDDFMICLEEEPEALRNFQSFTASEQNKYKEWIAAAKDEELKIERMARAITRISEGKCMWKQ